MYLSLSTYAYIQLYTNRLLSIHLNIHTYTPTYTPYIYIHLKTTHGHTQAQYRRNIIIALPRGGSQTRIHEFNNILIAGFFF